MLLFIQPYVFSSFVFTQKSVQALSRLKEKVTDDFHTQILTYINIFIQFLSLIYFDVHSMVYNIVQI